MFILEGYIKISKKTLEFKSSPSPNIAYPRVLKGPEVKPAKRRFLVLDCFILLWPDTKDSSDFYFGQSPPVTRPYKTRYNILLNVSFLSSAFLSVLKKTYTRGLFSLENSLSHT